MLYRLASFVFFCAANIFGLYQVISFSIMNTFLMKGGIIWFILTIFYLQFCHLFVCFITPTFPDSFQQASGEYRKECTGGVF